MENCLKFLPYKSYNTFGRVILTIFVSIGVVIVGIASDFESKASLQCNPDKTRASDRSTRKDIETDCFHQYKEEFNHFVPFYALLMVNFGLVVLLSIIYAYSVKHRVQIYADPSRETTNGDDDESQLLLEMSQAASDPMAHQGSSRFIVFTAYISHLIISRILPLVLFVALVFISINFPVQFDCELPMAMKSASTIHVNLTRSLSTNFSIVDCKYSMGKENEKLKVTVITTNLVFGTVAFIELTYLLWSTWKDRSLLADMEFCCVYLLRKRKRIKKLMRKIRENVSNDIFYVYDDFGEKSFSRRKLEEIYVNVIFQDGRESTSFYRRQFENRHETYEVHLKAAANDTVLKETADLFKPSGTWENYPRTILVVGRPGIGKTLLTQKMFYEWQQEALEFWHDKLVLLLRLRSFNQGETSLREMLRHSEGLDMSSADFKCMYEYVCLKPSNVVLIFDGLDELKFDYMSATEKTAVNSHNEVTHVLQIFKNLVKGKLLRGITVLTTSRPTAENIYQDLPFDRVVEILGFHEEQIQDYVEKFCRDDVNKSTMMWNFIKESPELLSLSYIPVNCYIICLTLRESIDIEEREETRGQNFHGNVPRTVTELYRRGIKILLRRHHAKYKDEPIPKDYMITKLPEQFQNDLDKLKKIARSGMAKDQLIFEFESGDEFAAGLSDCGVINKLDDKRQNLFCFLHLTIQEFLAALHVVDDLDNVESFLIENIRNPRWHLVIQFVAGLIGDKIRELREKRSTSARSTELPNDERTIECIFKRFQEWAPKGYEIDDGNTLYVIKCVHEMQEAICMELITAFSREDNDEKYNQFWLKNLNIAPVESSALFQFVGYINKLKIVKFTSCTMDHFSFRELAKLLKKNNEITDLATWDCGLSDEGANHIIDALKSENCKVRQLTIINDTLTAESAKCLSDALKSANCKLAELDINGNKLTDEGAACLSNALESDNCKVTKLNISRNELADEGAKYLSVVLKSDNCKLTELDISDNGLTDEGAEYFKDALKSDACKLTKLNISYNGVTDKGAKYLSDALESNNCKLTELDITGNRLMDAGANHLSEALKSDNCKLTKLYISRNELTDKGFKYLSNALMSANCKLVELDINGNTMTDEGARYLGNALENENCKLDALFIDYDRLTNLGCNYFRDAANKCNCKLLFSWSPK